MLLPIIGYSQFEYAVKLHNNARELNPNFSIDYGYLENEFIDTLLESEIDFINPIYLINVIYSYNHDTNRSLFTSYLGYAFPDVYRICFINVDNAILVYFFL
mgnify:CR=1 FL=1